MVFIMMVTKSVSVQTSVLFCGALLSAGAKRYDAGRPSADRAGDRVLDVCAAPGGKATELGAKLAGHGMLAANDISNSRAKGLLKNIEVFRNRKRAGA